MKEKCKKICKKLPFEFYIQNYKIIFIIFYPIFGVAHHKIRNEYVSGSNNNEYFNMFLYFLSYIFSIIPLIIFTITNRSKKDSKKEKEKEKEESEEDSHKNQIINEEIQKQEKIYIIKHIILIIFLLFVSVVFCHYNIKCKWNKRTIGLTYKIPIFFLLSYFILKYKYYKHHYISLGLITITLLTRYILNIIQSHSEKEVLRQIYQYFLFAFVNCTFLIFGKFYMDKFQKTPYLLMLIIGLFHCIVLSIIATIKYFTINKSYIFTSFKGAINSKEKFGLFMADIICQFIYKLGFWITTYYFTPSHTVISENIMEIYYYIYDFKKNTKDWNEKKFYINSSIIPTVLALNFILSLIFNEIFILKCCKLDYYTRKRIQEREIEDSNKLLEFKNLTIDSDTSINSNE